MKPLVEHSNVVWTIAIPRKGSGRRGGERMGEEDEGGEGRGWNSSEQIVRRVTIIRNTQQIENTPKYT